MRLFWLVMLPACSWALVEQPPRYDAGTRPLACTSSLSLPVVDTALAVVLAGAATTLFVTSHDARGGLAGGIAAGLAAIPYGFSGGYGYAQIGRCRRLGRMVRPRT